MILQPGLELFTLGNKARPPYRACQARRKGESEREEAVAAMSPEAEGWRLAGPRRSGRRLQTGIEEGGQAELSRISRTRS